MGDFTVIETQEQLDAVIGERLKRERETLAKKYNNYLSPETFQEETGKLNTEIERLNSALEEANSKIASHDEEMAEKDKKLKAYESHSVKTRIANEVGLSSDAIEFLTGDDEESIRKSAESLKSIVRKQNVPPLASGEMSGESSDEDAALRKTLRKLKGEE